MQYQYLMLRKSQDPAGLARTRPSRLLGAFGRVLSPLLLLIGLAGLWGHDAWLSRLEPGGPSLPPHARQRIDTQGGIIASLAFHPDGRRLFWADSLTGRIGTYDPELGGFQVGESFEGGAPRLGVKRLALSPDGRTVAAATLFGAVMVWASGLEESPVRLSPEPSQTTCLAFTSDGRQLVTAGRDGMVRAWDTATWSKPREWQAQDEVITCLDIAPDRRTLVVGSSTGRLRRWETGGGRRLADWWVHTYSVSAIVHSPSGRMLATAGSDGRVRLWDARTGRREWEFVTEDHSLGCCLAYAPDGSVLATGDLDRTVRLWDVATGRPLGRLKGHRGAVCSLAFSPDGRILSSAGDDGAIILWDFAAAMPAAPRAASPPVRRSSWPPATATTPRVSPSRPRKSPPEKGLSPARSRSEIPPATTSIEPVQAPHGRPGTGADHPSDQRAPAVRDGAFRARKC
jgi:hypothetical protein